MRFSYDQPKTEEELENAIAEALEQAESLEVQGEQLLNEADRWYDRAATLRLELNELVEAKGNGYIPGQLEIIDLNPDFFKKD